jgi:hypothetical protein
MNPGSTTLTFEYDLNYTFSMFNVNKLMVMHKKQESGQAFTHMHTQLRIFHIRAETECAHFDSPAAEFPPDAVAPAFQRPLARAIPDTK